MKRIVKSIKIFFAIRFKACKSNERYFRDLGSSKEIRDECSRNPNGVIRAVAIGKNVKRDAL